MAAFKKMDKLSGAGGVLALVSLALLPVVFSGSYLVGVLTVAAFTGSTR